MHNGVAFVMGTPRLNSPPGAIAVILAAAALAGACSPLTLGAKSPTPSAPASSNAAGSPLPSATPSPSPVPVNGSFGVLVSRLSDTTYSVSLIGVDGKVVASAQASAPPLVTCGNNGNGAYVPLPVSASNSRAYFLDAKGVVRFLAPDGATGRATTVPAGSGLSRSMFAVSPDDQRIAVVVADFTSSGASTKLYVENLNGGGDRVNPFSQTGSNTLWPIGWHGTNTLVVAKVPACVAGHNGFPLAIPYELHVVDPMTADRRFTLGGSSECVIVGPPSPAGAVCESLSASKGAVLDWTAGTTRTLAIGGTVGAYLSPQGKAIAFVTVTNTSTTFEDGKRTLSFRACGWIDDTHVLSSGDVQKQALVADVTNGATIPVAAEGTCAGRLPGGL